MKFIIKKGLDLRIKGVPSYALKEISLPSVVGVDPRMYKGIKPKLTVRPGDDVLIG